MRLMRQSDLKVRQRFPARSRPAGLATCSPALSRAAALTFYTTQAGFNAAAPGLPVEDFSNSAALGSPYYAAIPSPLSSTASDGVFTPGGVRPGLTLTTLNPGQVSTALDVEGSSGPKSVGTNWFQDTLVLGFSPAVSAVGENVFGNVYPGPGFAGGVTESVYNGAMLLGSKTITEAAGAGGFIGVTSPAANITGVNLLFTPATDMDSNTFVNDVAFGTAPEPSPAALIAVTSAVGLSGRRRRRRSQGRLFSSARPAPASALPAGYPCHTYSSASGRVCCFMPPSQWPALRAKTNW